MFKVLWLVLVTICWLPAQVGQIRAYLGNGFHLVDLFHPRCNGYHHHLCEAQDELWTSECSSKLSEERPQKKSEGKRKSFLSCAL